MTALEVLLPEWRLEADKDSITTRRWINEPAASCNMCAVARKP